MPGLACDGINPCPANEVCVSGICRAPTSDGTRLAPIPGPAIVSPSVVVVAPPAPTTTTEKLTMHPELITTTADFSLGGLIKGIGRVGGEIATSLIPGTLDDKVFDAIVNRGTGTAPIPGTQRAAPIPSSHCPGGNCFGPGVAIPRFPTGGGTKTVGTKTSSQAEGISPWGLYTSPEVVVVERRKCPRGLVLGKDGKCYSGLANSHRAHPRQTNPAGFISRADIRLLNRRNAVEEKVKRLAKKAGYSTKKR